MPVALTSRWWRTFPGAAGVLDVGQRLDLRTFFLAAPVSDAARLGAALRAGGVKVCGVAADEESGVAAEDGAQAQAALGAAAACASALRAPAVVVAGGGVGAALDPDLRGLDEAAWRAHRGAPPVAAAPEDVQALRGRGREAAALRAVRLLHAALAAGVPLAIRHGGGLADLLGFEETGWLLAELPRLALWVDPARAERLHRLGAAPPPLAWAEAYGARCAGVFVHGLGADGTGGAHPEDEGPAWDALVASLPRAVPWALDLAPGSSPGDVSDALRWTRARLGRT